MEAATAGDAAIEGSRGVVPISSGAISSTAAATSTFCGLSTTI